MTKLFDDSARTKYKESLKFFKEESLPENTKARQLYVRKGTVKEVRAYIATHHYSQTMPDSTMEVFMSYYGDIFAGACIFGMGAGLSQYRAVVPTIQKGEYRELTRLWSPDGMPKNTESKLISESIKLLPKEVKLLVSFADPSQGHLGKIYQATNWDYCGMTGGGKRLVDSTGKEFHSRLVGIYRIRHKNLNNKTQDEIMKIYNWTYAEGSKKHRYIKVLGNKKEVKQLRKSYELQIDKYPK